MRILVNSLINVKKSIAILCSRFPFSFAFISLIVIACDPNRMLVKKGEMGEERKWEERLRSLRAQTPNAPSRSPLFHLSFNAISIQPYFAFRKPFFLSFIQSTHSIPFSKGANTIRPTFFLLHNIVSSK